MPQRDTLPTGQPIINRRRSFGELPIQDRLGVGILGLHEGHSMLVALMNSLLCRPVAGCDPDIAKRDQAVATCPGLTVVESFEELLAISDVQIVAVYTPDSLHADQIASAFRAGKHVICTKPLVNDAAAGPELLRLSAETNCRLQVAQSTRFFEPFLRQRELVEAGALGEVECYDAHYVHRMDWYYEKSPWTITTTHWAYLGLSHPVDLIRLYLGDIVEVQAMGSTSALGRSFGLPTPDIISAQLRSADGRVGRVFGHYGVTEHAVGRSLIEGVAFGRHGTSIARYPDLRHSFVGQDGIEHTEDFTHAYAGYYYRHELKGMHYGEFGNIADSFARAILDGTPNAPDLREGLQTVNTMAAIVKALDSGQTEAVERIR